MNSPASSFEIGTDGPSLILVGVDGSRTSLRAGAYAAGLARRQGSRLLAVFVRHISASAGLSPGAAAAMSETGQEMADEMAELLVGRVAEIGIRADFESVAGDPFTELTRIATERRADLVVVGTSEQAGHRIIGSLATRLVRAGKWPVLVVP